MKTVITGIGWVTADSKGDGRNQERFAMNPGRLPVIRRADVFDKPDKHFGRMDEYSRVGLAAIAYALKDAGIDEWSEKRNIGIIASTLYGCFRTDVDYFQTVMSGKGTEASPNLFAYTLPNSFLGEAAIRFGIMGTSFIVNETSGLSALSMAIESLIFQEAETMLCGMCDLECPELFFDKNQLAPGALFFVIKKPDGKNDIPYGVLDMDQQRAIRFNGTEIKNLPDLASACMAYKKAMI